MKHKLNIQIVPYLHRRSAKSGRTTLYETGPWGLDTWGVEGGRGHVLNAPEFACGFRIYTSLTKSHILVSPENIIGTEVPCFGSLTIYTCS